MDINKVKDYIVTKGSKPKIFEQDYFELGICEIILGNFPKAETLFNESIPLMFGENPYWRASSQPNWLVEITILAGRPDLYPSIQEELTIYRLSSTKSSPVGNSPLAYYCYGIMDILYSNTGIVVENSINELLKRPKYKDLYATGLVLQSIVNQDQSAFNNTLHSLLKVHENKAKYGDLRWSPTGWLCLSAMALSFIATKKNLTMQISSDFLSKGYLEYISRS